MLTICRPLTSVPHICLVRSISQFYVKRVARAAVQHKAMSQALSSKSMLEDQAFGGDLLNRSVGDRRDANFVKTSFEGSGSLLISGRSVMAKQATGNNGSQQHTELCWLSPGDFAEYGITPQTDSQTTVTGKVYAHSRRALTKLAHGRRALAKLACLAQFLVNTILFTLQCISPLFRSTSRSLGPLFTWTHQARDLVLCH